MSASPRTYVHSVHVAALRLRVPCAFRDAIHSPISPAVRRRFSRREAKSHTFFAKSGCNRRCKTPISQPGASPVNCCRPCTFCSPPDLPSSPRRISPSLLTTCMERYCLRSWVDCEALVEGAWSMRPWCSRCLHIHDCGFGVGMNVRLNGGMAVWVSVASSVRKC